MFGIHALAKSWDNLRVSEQLFTGTSLSQYNVPASMLLTAGIRRNVR
jgi:hypothetical protein